ncbi:hypothetical protein H312_02084 [Anncaliia algerae PRA339]|uniref:14-3-3 domain-containing protein n=1 Tax=Anncaliia algerae PRA339 TaxID=1288291 RepID=A0A059F091_9MICR|nr:hypothetical protein H312_02084 [Anncaliia algerae PRA339]
MQKEELQTLLFSASVSERAERYEEMVQDVKDAIDLASKETIPLGLKGHSLFSVAYKNLAGSRRASWRVLCAEQTKYEKGSQFYRVIDEKISVVIKELCDICEEALGTIDAKILQMDDVKNNRESLIFFMKMKGDYYRYKAEVEEGEALNKSIESAKVAYEEAHNQAILLPPTSPVRLGLALNFSVFHYEILKKTDLACNMARKSFEDAITELDNLSEEHYKDTTLIMQLIRDNLTLWTSQPEHSQENIYEKPTEEINHDEGNFN